MKTVPIPGGEATLRDYEDLRGKDVDFVEDYILIAAPLLAGLPQEVLEGKDIPDNLDPETRERVEKQLDALVENPKMVRAFRAVKRACVIAQLASWTLDRPLPTDLDELAELPRDVVAALEEAVGGDAVAMVAGTDYSPNSNPKADISGSTPSEPLSTDEASKSPTPSSSESTDTTAIEFSTPA